MGSENRSEDEVTKVYGPEEQVLVLSEQLHQRRQSPFADDHFADGSTFPKEPRLLVFDPEIT